eukprot:2010_1
MKTIQPNNDNNMHMGCRPFSQAQLQQSPILPPLTNNFSNDWNITYTPHGSACNSPSNSHGVVPMLLLNSTNSNDIIPPPPPPNHFQFPAQVPMTTNWSLQESIINGGGSGGTPSNNTANKRHSLSIKLSNNALNVPLVYNDDNKYEIGDTPMDTPEPMACPMNADAYPNTQHHPILPKQQNTFHTISDSSASESSSSGSSSGSGSGSESGSESTTEQASDDAASDMDLASDQVTLSHYGYVIITTICETTHGCVYEAQIVESKKDKTKDPNKPRNSLKLMGKQMSLQCFSLSNAEHVAIKKVDKRMLNETDVLKEATILHYLSVLNKPPADNICEFVDCIETNTDFYLIQEYGGIQTLEEFIGTAHKYIEEKKMKLKHWRITVKFVFWQIAVMIYWMHNDMNTCHLDLNADNIMVKNGTFLLHKKDGSITVDSKGLTVKLSDFGFAEIFAFTKNDEAAFRCTKKGITKDHKHKSPQQFNGQTFDARKSDCYSLGVIMFQMLTGTNPYDFPSDADDGYLALKSKELQNYLATHGLNASFKKEIVSLVEGLMNIDEEERMDTRQILTHEWFKHYYSRYKLRIEQKTRSQKERHARQAKKMDALPYYRLNRSNEKHCVL